MKTVEELKSLRGEIETLNKKLAELIKDELAQVAGGLDYELKPSPSTENSHFNLRSGCRADHVSVNWGTPLDS